MKNILLVLFILTSFSSYYSQSIEGKAFYRFQTNGYIDGNSGSKCGEHVTRGLQWIALQFENNTFATVVQGSTGYPGSGNGLRQSIFSGHYDFTKHNKVNYVRYKTTRRTRSVGICKESSHRESIHGVNYCQNNHYNFDAAGLNQSGYANWSIKAKIELNTPTIDNNTISDDNYLTITLPDNIESQYYNWEYSVGDINNFQRFDDQYNNTPILKLKGKDFLSEDDFGKNIFIRVATGCDGSTSNVISFIYLKTAPKILSHQETAPLCFDGKGAVSFTFDRTLLPDETAEFVLNGKYIRDTNPSLNQHLVEQLRNGTTVTLPDAEHGTHTLSIVGTYKGHPTYSGAEQSRQFTITPPTPVEFSVTSSQNVFCHGGNDGHIQLSANGGLGDYQYSLDNGASWINFNQANTTLISNLEKGNYTIKVRDKNLCIAKENDNEKQVSVNITQPDAPISFNDIEVVEPKGYGLSNGYIVLTVKGGTPKTDGTYHYEWRKDSPTGAILTNVETSPNISNGFSFKLNNITAGKYYLTVKDAHYANASANLEACGILTQEFVVSQPDPLVSNIEVSKKISCHIDNQYEFKLDLNANGIPDESEDGALKSITTGGVPPYTYQWQKEINGSFQDISGATTSELEEQTIGKYKLLIEDANGNTTHTEYTFIYPEQLKIALQGRDLLCYNGNDGMAEVIATGGTGNYSYRWNNLEKTPKIENIAAGNYFVLVTDEHLCKVKENIDIHQPDEIIINDILVQDPLSPNANNGQIHIGLNGGNAPYTVSWSNGMTGEHISGLAEGTYIAQIQDANACLITKTYTLNDPERLPLDLGEDIVTLCLGDTKTYNVKINDPLATYTWTDANGNIISNQPEITLSQAGVYTITIVNSNGNTASDSVEIKLSSEVLQPEFMITTHAYVEAPVKLVNTSAIPPQSVEWIIPQNQGIQVVSQSDEYLEVIFPSVGGYTFGLKGKQGACEKTFYKNIIVEENIRGVNLAPTSISNIKEFSIAPNPNQGQFKVFIKLNQPASVKLRLMDIITHEVMTPIIKAKGTEFEIPIDINVAAANYFIILETGNEAQAQKVSIIR